MNKIEKKSIFDVDFSVTFDVYFLLFLVYMSAERASCIKIGIKFVSKGNLIINYL